MYYTLPRAEPRTWSENYITILHNKTFSFLENNIIKIVLNPLNILKLKNYQFKNNFNFLSVNNTRIAFVQREQFTWLKNYYTRTRHQFETPAKPRRPLFSSPATRTAGLLFRRNIITNLTTMRGWLFYEDQVALLYFDLDIVLI